MKYIYITSDGALDYLTYNTHTHIYRHSFPSCSLPCLLPHLPGVWRGVVGGGRGVVGGGWLNTDPTLAHTELLHRF